ncbi:MAG: PEGA domain-containing protein [Deltaproteobacteria bacterium]|nr:PEGA domain-containing protein [Deltaproteobacteria bacterium]
MAATVAALWLCALPSALAQSEDWLILPTTVEYEAPWMQTTATELSRELRRQGVGVWPADRAVSAFRARGSAAPPIVSESRMEVWAARSQQALRELALGDSARALEGLEAAQEFARSNLVSLNRDTTGAQAVLDTCLYLLRALVESGDEDVAARQARECVRMAPSGTPSRQMHPPTVVEIYEEALTPGPARASTLLVESEPSNCPLRINGMLAGKTPFQLTDLYPGRYAVQVECEPNEPSPVHTVEVPRGSKSLFVFDRFDRSVRTTPLLHLRYEDPPEPLRLARDARDVARALPASAVVVASATGPGVLELRVVTRTQAESAMVRIAMSATGPQTGAVVDGIAALLAGECRDFTHEDRLQLDCRTGEPVIAGDEMADEKPARARPPRGRFISGVTLASAGAASLLSGYGVLIARRAAADDWLADPGSLDAHNKWLNLGTGLIVTSSTGSALLVTSMPLMLPYKEKTPWWGWLSGGLGLGFAAASIATAVTADAKPSQSCSVNNLNPDACTSRAQRTDLAIVLGATAAPLLTVPLVYLFRKGEKKLAAELSPVIWTDRSGGVIAVRGAF